MSLIEEIIRENARREKCFNCKYYRQKRKNNKLIIHYCSFLDKPINQVEETDICPEIDGYDVVYVCPFPKCNYVADNLMTLKTHAKIHVGDYNSHCPVCGLPFNNDRSILIHMIGRSDLDHKCMSYFYGINARRKGHVRRELIKYVIKKTRKLIPKEILIHCPHCNKDTKHKRVKGNWYECVECGLQYKVDLKFLIVNKEEDERDEWERRLEGFILED